jgi:Fe2+ or Zn2+ uptake regulation protein
MAALAEHPTVDEELVARLRARGLRVTSQRVVIHRALRTHAQHLSAEQVFEHVAVSLPGTSLPTVYATLELLVELGLARRVSTGAGPTLFDSRLEPHAHAVCSECGALADIDEPLRAEAAVRRARAAGFRPDHAQLVIWGRCAKCAENQRS